MTRRVPANIAAIMLTRWTRWEPTDPMKKSQVTHVLPNCSTSADVKLVSVEQLKVAGRDIPWASHYVSLHDTIVDCPRSPCKAAEFATCWPLIEASRTS
jgi:hypothetical protein